MSATSTTALDLITGALRDINALESGEVPTAQDANDALQVLNDLLESWSIEKLFIFSSTENRFVFNPVKLVMLKAGILFLKVGDLSLGLSNLHG